MALHPHVVKRAQAEIDSVIGGLRLPTLEDRPHLPYLEAIYREVMRWRPAAPLGLPHAISDDDIYEGYFMPKGTIVITNIWGMGRDESLFTDPETFKPERFLGSDGELNGDDKLSAFGFGRRICPGRYFADVTLWSFIASSLAVFDFAQAKDDQGQLIPIDVDDYTETLIAHIGPFQCSITPRSSSAEALINEATS
ncbi:hypothetical protein HGRIS_003142 [Hohenbuehelia grisea]|uniref:Cytochrome P450 n=1 Tax=Hohenbuehelia grisea TaxID=104357 RepID=A0ABR3JMT9_9AGAR